MSETVFAVWSKGEFHVHGETYQEIYDVFETKEEVEQWAERHDYFVFYPDQIGNKIPSYDKLNRIAQKPTEPEPWIEDELFEI